MEEKNGTNGQIEIKEKCLMLDENGRPARPGYCKRNLYIYNKENIRKHRMRIKEWDFYVVTDGRVKVELNFFNISYAAAVTAELFDFQSKKTYSDFAFELLSGSKYTLSPASDAPFEFTYEKAGRRLSFVTEENSHRLYFRGKTSGKPFEIKIEGDRLPGQESLTTLTPFDQEHCFYCTQKLNCIRVSGTVTTGDGTFTLDPEKAFMTIDWGRGVWPCRNRWIWSNGSTMIEGRRFGFEMTWGFGDNSRAPAAALFYDGKCSKIGRVRLEAEPAEDDCTSPWHFISEDGRLDLTLTPEIHHTDGVLIAGMIGHRSRQVYGRFNGRVILDDGTKLDVADMFAFVERVKNGW